tara:strand:+ start:614 stop:2911 length:2298 start_codon:yes stop_codon:yes gene_type:complete
MRHILEYSHDLLYSYGLAIIVLSLTVNFLLIPFYHIIQKWQKEDSAAQQRMAEKKAEIKKVYQGKERFMMLKALYKQHHYRPIMQLKSICGLLIQIPFFIAAYELLTQVMPLYGQAFGRIADLSASDGLFHLGTWSIHVLPILMTLISLLSVFFYTKATSQSEKAQLYGISLFFLIILYSAPSSLVLYWTVNNVFSLGRVIINWLEQTSKPYYRKYVEAKHFIGLTLLLFSLLSLLVGFLLPQGLTHDALLGALPFYAWIPCLYALSLTYKVIVKKKTLQKKKREPMGLRDLSLVLLIMIPLAQYIATNLNVLKVEYAIALTLLFISSLCMILIVLPHAFSHLISKKALQVSLLCIMILLCYMPIFYGMYHLEKLKNILGLVAGIFILSMLFIRYNYRPVVLFLTILLGINTYQSYTKYLRSLYHAKIESPITRNHDISFPNFKNNPNVYLLTYDAYVSQEVMLQYGIDNASQESYLKNQGFTIYPQVYSLGFFSIFSMSSVLDLSYGQGRAPVAGKGFVPDIFKKNGYQTAGIFKNTYYLINTEVHYDEYVPKVIINGAGSLLQALTIGELDSLEAHYNLPYEEFVDTKNKMLNKMTQQPRFVYTHTGPGHSQLSGHCYEDEIEQFQARLIEANQEMKHDLETIQKIDPDAVIIINGDHGPQLTKTCFSIQDASTVNRLDMLDRHGSFVAIKMPHTEAIPQKNIRILQDIFPEVFNALAQTTTFSQVKLATRSHGGITDGVYIENGIIHGGINDGEPLYASEKR